MSAVKVCRYCGENLETPIQAWRHSEKHGLEGPRTPDPVTDRCVVCRKEHPIRQTYRTGAGTICFNCSADFSSEKP